MLLPAHTVDEIVAAVSACLDNVVLHVGRSAPSWVLLESFPDRVVVSVRDEGPGIPREARDTVFDVFYRVRAGDRQAAGTGLGLSICRGLVEAHGGRIEALPGPAGRGATIAFWLPLQPVPAITDGGDEDEREAERGGRPP